MTGTALDIDDDLLTWAQKRDAQSRGETFSEALDGSRLRDQALAVARVMQSGAWFTLQELKDAGVPGMLTSISARVREVRRWLEETGRGTIERQRDPVISGLWKYRIVKA